MGTYHVFISCEDDVFIESECLDNFLNKKLINGCLSNVKCFKKHENIVSSKDDFDELKESSIYVLNTHRELDYITSWEIGYAMGIGLKIIGYYDGKNSMKIPPDLEELIHPIPSNVTRFVNKINRALDKLHQKEYPLKEEEYTRQLKSAEMEMETI